ncbi:hypothetical protein [Phytoactinopolyspora halotolerans]|uniref:Uncharacterized protein n=1 Tax=Phytoactinopolyspora halotolerans TaxID=1981512 RepID=A0A6L9S924_9ACTN|nr:hypothetical protein [Phytoactinopolyspora halotolerans]NEE01523.1 hypothetical protein [Phytoactinopolyspora halotolerans]
MNKVNALLRIVYGAENNLARRLRAIGDRHSSDHEIYHVSRDLAGWSEEHARLLAGHARERGYELGGADRRIPRPWHILRAKAGELTGRRPETGLLAVWDMRKLHLDAVGLSLDWEIVGQTAQALKDEDLLALSTRCHPDTLRQARWANHMVKTLSPQAMAS